VLLVPRTPSTTSSAHHIDAVIAAACAASNLRKRPARPLPCHRSRFTTRNTQALISILPLTISLRTELIDQTGGAFVPPLIYVFCIRYPRGADEGAAQS